MQQCTESLDSTIYKLPRLGEAQEWKWQKWECSQKRLNNLVSKLACLLKALLRFLLIHLATFVLSEKKCPFLWERSSPSSRRIAWEVRCGWISATIQLLIDNLNNCARWPCLWSVHIASEDRNGASGEAIELSHRPVWINYGLLSGYGL